MKKPDNSTKAVAKSLHTLTVIFQVARLIQTREGSPVAADAAIEEAMTILELAGRPDPYGLRDRALAHVIAAASADRNA